MSQITICVQCGRIPSDTPGQKYCGDGSDKDHGHRYQQLHQDIAAVSELRTKFFKRQRELEERYYLKEFSNEQLYAELARRRELTERGLCSFCGKNGLKEVSCSQVERHMASVREMQARNHHMETGVRIGFRSINYGPNPQSPEAIRAMYKW